MESIDTESHALGFDGFDVEAFSFLDELSRRRKPGWLDGHRRSEFDALLQRPLERLVRIVGMKIGREAPRLVADPTTSVLRIHRDTRFAADKSPYKRELVALLPDVLSDRYGPSRAYLAVTPDGLDVAAGVYYPSPLELKRLRTFFAEEGGAPAVRIALGQTAPLFGKPLGDSTVGMPRGFDPKLPNADLVRKKAIWVKRTIPARIAATPKLLGEVTRSLLAAYPLVEALAAAFERREGKKRKRAA